jgi:hypothetical protein
VCTTVRTNLVNYLYHVCLAVAVIRYFPVITAVFKIYGERKQFPSRPSISASINTVIEEIMDFLGHRVTLCRPDPRALARRS